MIDLILKQVLVLCEALREARTALDTSGGTFAGFGADGHNINKVVGSLDHIESATVLCSPFSEGVGDSAKFELKGESGIGNVLECDSEGAVVPKCKS